MTPDRDDLELDQLLRVVRDRYIARSDATFDFEAGLTDVRERAGLQFGLVPARRIPPGPRPLAAAVALVCEHIEDLVVALDCLLLSGPLPDLAGSQIQRATEVLLRVGQKAAAGTVNLIEAGEAFDTVRDALSQADLILLVEQGLSLSAALAAAGRPVGDLGAGSDRTDCGNGSAIPEHGLDQVLHQLVHEITAALAAQVEDRAHDQAGRDRPDQRLPRAQRAGVRPRRRSADGR